MRHAHVDVTGAAGLLPCAEAVTGTRRNYVIVLAAAAAVILTIGSLLRPAPDAQRGPDPTPSDVGSRAARTALAAAHRRRRRTLFHVGRRSLGRVARPSGRGRADGSRLGSWPGHHGGSRVADLDDVERDRAWTNSCGRDGRRRADPPAADPPGGLAAQPARRSSRRQDAPQAGAWVLAVWRTGDQRAFASGHFVGVRARSSEFLRWDDVTSTVVLTEDMRGGGLFDLDGRLLGVILPADAGLSVIAASTDSPSWPRPCRPLSSRRWRSSRSSGPSARGLPSCTPAKPAWPRSRRPIPFSSHRRPRGGSRDQGPTVSTAFPENRLAIRSSATDPISVHGRSTLIWG